MSAEASPSPQPPNPRATHTNPRGTTFPIIAAAVATLIAYGSLFPFHFVAPADFRASLESLLADRKFWTSLSDVLGNVALFMPFGAAVVWWTSERIPRRNAVLLTVFVGFAFAFVLQVGQIFVPGRAVAMADVLWNGVGTLLGTGIGLVIELLMRARGRRIEAPELLVLVLLLLWFIAELAPLVPALDIAGIKRSLKPLFVNPRLDPAVMLYATARVLLMARLLATLVGPRRGTLGVALVAGAVLIGKVFVVNQTCDLTTVAGFTIAVAIWAIWTHWLSRPMASMTLLFFLLFAYSLQQLSPFTLRAQPSSFSWVPFAAALEGSMLANARALATSAFTLAGCVWLIGHMGIRFWTTAILLALWVLLLEWIQTWITGRTASITDPLLVLSAAWLIDQMKPRTADTVRTVGSTSQVIEPPRLSRAVRLRAPLLALATAVTVLAGGIGSVLRLPGVPYNVSELFLEHGSALALTIFAFALIWVGAGSMLLAHWLAFSRRPYLVLPVGMVVVSMISRTLLKYSVTYESLDDILGTNSLFGQVTKENIWGDFGRHVFLVMDAPNFVAYFERRIRYLALYSPLVVCLALAMLPLARSSYPRPARSWLQLGGLAATAIAWLWLSKAFMITWAATDNLTELIAQRGPLGLNGGLFLYLIIALMAINTALLVRATDQATWWPIALILSMIAIPASWVLLKAGLEQHIYKYGVVFSGTQFLLGPDRQHILSDMTLFMRWAFVYGGGVTVLCIGAWIAHRFVARQDVTVPGSSSLSTD